MRIRILDAWRSAAVLCMLIYHFLYDVCVFGMMSWETFYSPFFNGLQRFICYSFILLAGISSNFSRSNLKRGGITLACAVVVGFVSGIAGLQIRFGILHFMGFAMLIFGFAGKYLKKISWKIGFIASLLLFFLARLLVEYVGVVESTHLWILGFPYAGFQSADYFPLLPWIFLFFAGGYLGEFVVKNKEADFFTMELPKPVTWLGENSLVIYLLHQPVLYGLTMGIAYIFKAG